MTNEQKMVTEFHTKFGGVVNAKPTMIDHASRLKRASLIMEEASEFVTSARNNDMVGMCDALADILYVTVGSAVEMGVDLETIFKCVHASNMTKVVGMDIGGKIQKGQNFVPPDIASVLEDQGWQEGA